MSVSFTINLAICLCLVGLLRDEHHFGKAPCNAFADIRKETMLAQYNRVSHDLSMDK